MEYPVNYDSPADLAGFLESENLSMKKRFGQNFLVNRGAREKIIGFMPLEEADRVWEIGPGLGAMTWHLLEKKADVTVYEIDHGFIKLLKDFYGDRGSFSIVEGDFLKNLKNIIHKKTESPDYILGNLPYVTGSVMIAEIIKSFLEPKRMVFTLQKEVGQRMAAKPGSRDFSSFSLVCQSKYDVFLRGELKPGSFHPRPAVKSIIVELMPHGHFNPGNPDIYYQLVDDLFRARRKKISNNLAAGKTAAEFGKEFILEALGRAEISPDCRAETLSVADVERLSNKILELK